jgi:ion channel-forming bestrophin family protein
MIVGKTPRIRQTFTTAWRTLGALFVWDVAVTIFYFLSPFRAPALPLTLFGTALALFLGFRVNSAYQRWWEARILWGQMTNASRSFARQMLTLIGGGPASQSLKSELILRQIAYVHVLRCQLRRQDPGEGLRRVFADAEEMEELTRRNPANGLLEGSAQLVARARDSGWLDTIQQSRIEALMVDISNAQGGMERLKNTPLPAQYRSFPIFFTRLFTVLLPIGLVETLGVATPVGSAVAGFMYLAVLQIGDDLVDPFANTVHDAPLMAMCLTIEADLMQAIGRPAPEPLQPENGVLW